MSSVGATAESGCPRRRGHRGLDVPSRDLVGTGGCRSCAGLSVPFWSCFLGRVEWFPRQDVPHGCVFGPPSGFYRKPERQPAEAQEHWGLAGTRVGVHQAGGCQHRLSRGCKSSEDPMAGGEPGTSWSWFWQQASAHGRCLPPSPLVTDFCGITLLIKASYPVCQSCFIKKLYPALARLCICKWGNAQALIETSWGSSAWDPRESPVLGGAGGSGGSGGCQHWGTHPSHLPGSGSRCVCLGPWQEPQGYLGLGCLRLSEAPASQLQPPHPPRFKSSRQHRDAASALCTAAPLLIWGAEGEPLLIHPPPP